MRSRIRRLHRFGYFNLIYSTMNHLITFQESLKNKGINTYDIGKTNYDPEHPWRGVRKTILRNLIILV